MKRVYQRHLNTCGVCAAAADAPTTRHATGVRGVAFAYVKAFDRYVNLILQDVTETYTAGGDTRGSHRRPSPAEQSLAIFFPLLFFPPLFCFPQQRSACCLFSFSHVLSFSFSFQLCARIASRRQHVRHYSSVRLRHSVDVSPTSPSAAGSYGASSPGGGEGGGVSYGQTVSGEGGGDDSRRVKTKTKTESRTRHVQQVFLRGEQVVSVAIQPGGGEWMSRGPGTASAFYGGQSAERKGKGEGEREREREEKGGKHEEEEARGGYASSKQSEEEERRRRKGSTEVAPPPPPGMGVPGVPAARAATGRDGVNVPPPPPPPPTHQHHPPPLKPPPPPPPPKPPPGSVR